MLLLYNSRRRNGEELKKQTKKQTTGCINERLQVHAAQHSTKFNLHMRKKHICKLAIQVMADVNRLFRQAKANDFTQRSLRQFFLDINVATNETEAEMQLDHAYDPYVYERHCFIILICISMRRNHHSVIRSAARRLYAASSLFVLVTPEEQSDTCYACSGVPRSNRCLFCQRNKQEG